MERVYRIGTRTSPLALKQAEEAICRLKAHYPTFGFEVVGFMTAGDVDKTTPLSDREGSDFFTREIDEALLRGEIDFSIHSAKDVADTLDERLSIAAITESVDPGDVLVSKGGLTLDALPYGAAIGTSSRRRKEQLKEYRDDFRIVDIRGNLGERLNLLDRSAAGEIDAIVIAAAGLIRLGLEDRISQRLNFEIIQPHPLQGALAILIRKGEIELDALLSVLDAGARRR